MYNIILLLAWKKLVKSVNCFYVSVLICRILTPTMFLEWLAPLNIIYVIHNLGIESCKLANYNSRRIDIFYDWLAAKWSV